MNDFILLFIWIILSGVILFVLKKLTSRNAIPPLIRKTKTAWLDLTRDQRKALDEQEKQDSMNRKKSLLSEIRKEYKRIKTISHSDIRPPFKPLK